MSRSPLSLTLPDADIPLFLRVADAVVGAIRRRQLQAGQRLPGTRALARSLGVHRNTVLAAFAELESQGWLRSVPSSGTYVAADVPNLAPPKPLPPPSATAWSLPEAPGWLPRPSAPPPRGALVLAGGRPDLATVPTDALARAWRRGMRRHAAALLDYGDPRGTEGLRRALGAWLTQQKGLVVPPERLMVTRGAQMALYLVSQALLRPGDRVAVESYGYPPAWAALRAAGATLHPIEVDREGLDVEALEAAHAHTPFRAVYLTPHHQFPTMVALSPGRRARLLSWAAAARVALIEDDYDHEFHYAGRPVLPLAAGDEAGVVIYVGTLSKVLAPGLRTGFVVAPTPLIERLAALRSLVDRQGDAPMEQALAELIEDGELQRHMGRTRRIYLSRRDALARALREKLSGVLDFELPPGGLAIWARSRVDTLSWARRGAERGVVFTPGQAYHLLGTDAEHLRLGYGGLREDQLVEAVDRMVGSLPKGALAGQPPP